MRAQRAMAPEGLDRFVEAQADVWPRALAEIRAGQKESHWMWFIWPQLRGLGLSAMAQIYGLAGRDEALAYLAHPVLGPRLLQISRVMLAHRAKPAAEVLGPVDAMKLRSSMTLFEAIAPDQPVFADLLRAFFDGTRCDKTLALLAGPG
jgi:uncharacterized protein (DUF1810 family)